MIEKVKLNFRFEGQRQKILKSRGVDGMCFAGQKNAFDFSSCVTRIKPKDILGTIPKGISPKRQMATLNRILDHPLRGNPIIGVGSFPSDMRAKMIALNIMDAAIAFQGKKSNKRNARVIAKDYPLWHKVFGGFPDKLRDGSIADSPSLLVLSNIDINSTAMKIEKVRDILEMYTDIPRIVVVSGKNPMSFFANRLHLPMNFGFFVGPDARDISGDVLDML